MKEITLYSDGGADPNPGPGGYGVVLLCEGRRKELSGGFRLTTNNRMEILSVIVGLEALKSASRVTVYSDSRYVVDAVSKRWLESWQARNWVRKEAGPVKNADLWRRLVPLLEFHDVTFKWVRGHTGVPENERCDQLATEALRQDDLLDDEGYLEEQGCPEVSDSPSGSRVARRSTVSVLVRGQGVLPLAGASPAGREAAPTCLVEVAVSSPPLAVGAHAPLKIQSQRNPVQPPRASAGPPSGGKVTAVGQACRKCGTPVVKKIPAGKGKGKRLYTYAYYLFCPGCCTNYMVDDAKVPVPED
jgi:ribonuclease HI